MEIKRNITTPREHVEKQLTAMITRKYPNYDVDKVQQAVSKVMGRYEDPEVRFYFRGKNKDKHIKTAPVSKYLQWFYRSNLVMVPTWTTYIRPGEEESPEGSIVGESVEQRNIFKDRMKKALVHGDHETYIEENTNQVAAKTDSNSISGGISVGGTPLQAPSTHSSLTSTSRTSTSTTNSSIERLLTGRLHLKDPDSTMGYLLYICSHIEGMYDQYQDLVDSYQLVIPTVEDIMAMIETSSRYYWRHPKKMEWIASFVRRLNDIERVAIYYNGSLHALVSLNPQLIDVLILGLCKQQRGKIEDYDKGSWWEVSDEIRFAIVHLFSKELKGVGVDIEDADPQVRADIMETVKVFKQRISEISKIMDLFILSSMLPPNVGHYKEAIRDAVVVNDTDSGIYHIGYWVERYFGDARIYDDRTIALVGVLGYFALECFTQAIEVQVTNMNVDNSEKHIEMKTELTLPMLALPPNSKHYFASTSIVEGNVLPKRGFIRKGVNYRNAAVSGMARDTSSELQEYLAECIETGKRIDEKVLIELIVTTEEYIYAAAYTDVSLYRKVQVKDASSYKKESSFDNITKWEEFWNTVYGHKGKAVIPYDAITVPVTLKSKAALRDWLGSLPEEVRMPVSRWIRKYKRGNIETMYLPKEIISRVSFPEEIRKIIDVKKMVLSTCKMLYMSMHPLGIYVDPKMTFKERFYGE
jgi:hypothetical protein